MKTFGTKIGMWVWIHLVVAGSTGCLDLDLLDDMAPMDAGAAEASGENNVASTSQSGESGEPTVPSANPADTTAPKLVSIECGPMERADGELCIAQGPLSASIRFAVDEPCTFTFEPVDGLVMKAVSEAWKTLHHSALTGLSDQADTPVTLRVSDINGNETAVTVSVRGSGGPAIAVTEVLADPLGTEPAQEFVEVVNFGATSVDMSGWMVDDNGDANGDLLPSGTILGAGQIALIVSSTYVVDTGEDPSPPSETMLVFLDGSIASNGLKNGEAETVELYDESGTLVSVYDGSGGAPKEGISATRLFAELPDGDTAAFTANPSGTSSPGIAARLE